MVNFYQKYTYSIIVINLTNFEYVFKTILFYQTFSINYTIFFSNKIIAIRLFNML